jgi:hypothetical protein
MIYYRKFYDRKTKINCAIQVFWLSDFIRDLMSHITAHSSPKLNCFNIRLTMCFKKTYWFKIS